MGRFTLVENEVWEDGAFVELEADARLLFLWSFTNRAAGIGGLYPASLRQMSRSLPACPDWPETEERVIAALDQLAAKPLVLYDFDAEVVWVVNRAKHANRSPKVTTAIRREFESCPASPLREQFQRRYSGVLSIEREVA